VKVSIVIPVYNELTTVREVLLRVLGAPLPSGCSREVIVVDDGSNDGTGALLAEFEARLVVAYQSGHVGKGAALRAGIARATGDVILVQDGDLEYDPADYPRLVGPIVDGVSDVVYGSRFREASWVRGMRPANWLANRILVRAANLLTGAGITDEATAYKAFRATVLRRLTLRCARFEFCPEVTAKVRRLGYDIHEVPVAYRPRSVRQGKKVRWYDAVHALWTLVKYRFAPMNVITGVDRQGSVRGFRVRAADSDARP
jgi:glycosyltransferase involved in cell wall biosynthesis